MKKGIATLKSYFETGDIPTQAQFEDLIDSLRHLDDGQTITDVSTDSEGVVTVTLSDGNAISIKAPDGSNFLSSDGDTMTGNLIMTNQEVKWEENTDYAAIGFKNNSDSDNNSYLYFKTGDNEKEHFKWLHHPTGAAEVEWMSLKKNELDVKGSIRATSGNIFGNGKELLRFTDQSTGWLELNPSQAFGGVRCGEGKFRVEGKLEVGPFAGVQIYPEGNALFRKDVQFTSTNGNGVSFLGSNHWKIYGSEVEDPTYGGRVNGETKSVRNMYFRITGDDNGWVFKKGGSNVAGITARGDARFTGSIYAYGNVSAFSDGRLKADQRPLAENILDKIDQLQPTAFRWKDETKDQAPQLGFIAQEVQEQFPEWVHKNGEHLSMSYDKMGAVLAVKGLQELRAEVNALKAELKTLKDGLSK